MSDEINNVALPDSDIPDSNMQDSDIQKSIQRIIRNLPDFDTPDEDSEIIMPDVGDFLGE